MSFFSRLGAALKAFRSGGLAWSGQGGGWWNAGQGSIGGFSTGRLTALPGTDWDYVNQAGDLRLNSVVAAIVAWQQRTYPEPRLIVVDAKDQKTEKGDHPLTALLRRPNPYYSGDRLWQATLPDFTTTGNAYWLKRRNAGGQVVQLQYVPAGQMRPVWPAGGPTEVFIAGYEYRVDGFPYQYRVEDVIHFRFGQHPENARLGWSPLEAGLREVASLNEGATYRGAVLRNMGVVGAALMPADQAAAEALLAGSDEVVAARVERIKARWKALFTGDNRGGLFLPTFASRLEKPAFSPQELDIREMLAWDADMVCALLGIPSMVLGLPSAVGHDTYANAEAAGRAAVVHNMMPTQRLLAEELEVQLLPDLGNGDTEALIWDYSEVKVLKEDQDALYTRNVNAWAHGAITRAQFKTAIGEPPAEDGSDDIYLLPTGSTLIHPDGTPLVEPEPPPAPIHVLPPGEHAPPGPEPGGPTRAPAAAESAGDRAARNGTAAKAAGAEEIQPADVEAALALWDDLMPAPFHGLLEALPRDTA